MNFRNTMKLNYYKIPSGLIIKFLIKRTLFGSILLFHYLVKYIRLGLLQPQCLPACLPAFLPSLLPFSSSLSPFLSRSLPWSLSAAWAANKFALFWIQSCSFQPGVGRASGLLVRSEKYEKELGKANWSTKSLHDSYASENEIGPSQSKKFRSYWERRNNNKKKHQEIWKVIMGKHIEEVNFRGNLFSVNMILDQRNNVVPGL